MSKAQELIDFAKNNGIFIHSRTSPQEWEQLLAENDGRCPCGHAESCPCELALEKINNPNQKEEIEYALKGTQLEELHQDIIFL